MFIVVGNNGASFDIIDTNDGVVESYTANQVAKILRMGIVIEGLSIKDGKLIYKRSINLDADAMKLVANSASKATKAPDTKKHVDFDPAVALNVFGATGDATASNVKNVSTDSRGSAPVNNIANSGVKNVSTGSRGSASNTASYTPPLQMRMKLACYQM